MKGNKLRGYPPMNAMQYCRFCGSFIGNQAIHKMWHKSIDALVRRVVRPNMTEEEWIEFTNSPEFVIFASAEVNKQITEIEVVEELESVAENAVETVLEIKT